MKTTYISLCFYLFFIQISIGQTNKKLNDKEPIQTILQFENPLPKADALAKFKTQNKLDKSNRYVPTYSNTDETGRKHEHFQQYYKGLKIEFGVIITHSINDEVYLINGEIYNASAVNSTPTLTALDAFNKILDSKPNTKYLWESPQDAIAMNYSKPNGELLFLPNIKTGLVNLAYKFDIYSIEPLARDEIYVDAHSGIIIYNDPIIKHANSINATKNSEVLASVNGTANTKYSGTRTIKTTYDTSTNSYILNYQN
jgi:Zn-dependent metalloprotease